MPFFQTHDPIEDWIRKLIARILDGVAPPGRLFSTVEMPKEGLGVYLAHEQDPYWGVEALMGYLVDERVPVPDGIAEEMRLLVGPDTQKLEDLLAQTPRNQALDAYLETLEPLAEEP